MKIIITFFISILIGCTPQMQKYFFENPFSEIAKDICEGKCNVYEYDEKYIELTYEYEHPWCICMTQCFAERSIEGNDSSFCNTTNTNPANSLKNKIKYNSSIKVNSMFLN